MKKMISSMILSALALFVIASFAPVSALEPSDAEMEKMFTVLIEDEYNTQATYNALIEEFGVVMPFARLVRAEARHIDALETLFETYDFDLPVVDVNSVKVPGTLEEAYALGVSLEKVNIALYEDYLEADLPEDVERVFTNLMNSSKNHLRAFENAVDGNIGTGTGRMGNPVARQTRLMDCDLTGDNQALNQSRQGGGRFGRTN